MNRTWLLILLLYVPQIVFGQEKTKREFIDGPWSNEVIRVLKQDNSVKHGKYKRTENATNMVLEEGLYDHNEKVGIWKYYYRRSGKTPTLEQSMITPKIP